MKEIQLCGIGNAIVDVIADISEEDFSTLGFEKGTMRLVSTDEQKPLLDRFKSQKTKMVSGGSVANSIIAFSQLGGKSAFCGVVADDRYGNFYRDEFVNLGSRFPNKPVSGEHTGTCVSIITPDAERTMRTSLAASSCISAEFVDESSVKNSEWVLLEGYLFANSDLGQSAIKKAVDIATTSDTKIAITCSEPWVVSSFGETLNPVIEKASLVFCNEEESLALSGESSIEKAGSKLSKRIPHLIITGGPKGAYIWWKGEAIHVPAFPCQPRDLTGAGDMFAGSFLYGITHGLDPKEAARKSCLMSREVITQIGARLDKDVKAIWSGA